jgi:hypothetical protein
MKVEMKLELIGINTVNSIIKINSQFLELKNFVKKHSNSLINAIDWR